jgi:hypothetical protein
MGRSFHHQGWQRSAEWLHPSGATAGPELQLAQCPETGRSNGYFEDTWSWLCDNRFEILNGNQMTVYSALRRCEPLPYGLTQSLPNPPPPEVRSDNRDSTDCDKGNQTDCQSEIVDTEVESNILVFMVRPRLDITPLFVRRITGMGWLRLSPSGPLPKNFWCYYHFS